MSYRNLAVASVLGLVVLSVVAGVRPLDIGAQSPNQAGLVVQMGDGALLTRCVAFAEDEISGYDLLMRSGLRVVAVQSGGMGVTVCKIEDEGCPASNCFCGCSGSTCAYWSYWRLVGDEWSYSSVGALGRRLHSGDVDGWTWGTGDPPPVVPLAEICAPPATATSTVPPTPTSLLAKTATLPPTVTYTPHLAGTVTALPVATGTPALPALASPTPLPSATLTGTPRSVAAQRAPSSATPTREATPSLPTTEAGQAMPAVGPQDRGGRSDYVLFGILIVVLLAVIVVILMRRRR